MVTWKTHFLQIWPFWCIFSRNILCILHTRMFLSHLSAKFHQEKKLVNIHPESCEKKKKKSSKVLPSFIWYKHNQVTKFYYLLNKQVPQEQNHSHLSTIHSKGLCFWANCRSYQIILNKILTSKLKLCFAKRLYNVIWSASKYDSLDNDGILLF
jgi:hypothetical protein